MSPSLRCIWEFYGSSTKVPRGGRLASLSSLPSDSCLPVVACPFTPPLATPASANRFTAPYKQAGLQDLLLQSGAEGESMRSLSGVVQQLRKEWERAQKEVQRLTAALAALGSP